MCTLARHLMVLYINITNCRNFGRKIFTNSTVFLILTGIMKVIVRKLLIGVSTE